MCERDIVERLRGQGVASREEAAAEILRLRAELATARRDAWIAGRDAAVEVCRREGNLVKAEDYDNYAIGREVACHACMTTIKAMEPPA